MYVHTYSNKRCHLFIQGHHGGGHLDDCGAGQVTSGVGVAAAPAHSAPGSSPPPPPNMLRSCLRSSVAPMEPCDGCWSSSWGLERRNRSWSQILMKTNGKQMKSLAEKEEELCYAPLSFCNPITS